MLMFRMDIFRFRYSIISIFAHNYYKSLGKYIPRALPASVRRDARPFLKVTVILSPLASFIPFDFCSVTKYLLFALPQIFTLSATPLSVKDISIFFPLASLTLSLSFDSYFLLFAFPKIHNESRLPLSDTVINRLSPQTFVYDESFVFAIVSI